MAPEEKTWLLVERPHLYLNWVNQVLDAHRAPCITKFRFFFRQIWSINPFEVEKWVRFALSKNVEDLDVHLIPNNQPPLTRFSLGFDILKNRLYSNALGKLKSLRLSGVDISGESLEFILLRCRFLERLCVDGSERLRTLNIVSYKLKHLSVIVCIYLKELKIDAVNLISFHYKEGYNSVHTRIMFIRVPKLVDASFDGAACLFPFPIMRQIQCLFNQLTSLSFCPNIMASYCHLISQPLGAYLQSFVLFPNVKQLTLSVDALNWAAIIFFDFFIWVCPVLDELKLQIDDIFTLKGEAKQLQEIELEHEKIDSISKVKNSYFESQEEEKLVTNKEHVHLKVLEIVGFHGFDKDVNCVLSIIARSKCFQTLICNPRSSPKWVHEPDNWMVEEVRRRARKLALLLPPGVRVGVRDINGLV